MHYQEVRSQRLDGSGAWLLQMGDFVIWRDGRDRSRVLREPGGSIRGGGHGGNLRRRDRRTLTDGISSLAIDGLCNWAMD